MFKSGSSVIIMDFLDNTRIGTKLIGSFLILAVLLGIVAGIGYVNMKTINDGMTTMYGDRLIPIDDLGVADSAFYELRGDIYKYLSIPDKRADTKAAILESEKVVTAHMDGFRSSNLLDAEKVELKKFDDAWARYQELVTKNLDLLDAGKDKEVIASLGAGELTSTRKEIGDALGALITINQKAAENLNTQGDETFAASTLTILVMGNNRDYRCPGTWVYNQQKYHHPPLSGSDHDGRDESRSSGYTSKYEPKR